MHDSTIPPPPSRALVIEDATEVRRAVERNLRALGIDAAGASTGEEGLTILGGSAFDLLVLDINMPGMDGFEVLRAVRADPRTATLPVILMTARDDRASVRQGMSLGADDYLTKPFTAEELRETVLARLAHRSRLDARARDEVRRAAHTDRETGLRNAAAYADVLARPDGRTSAGILAIELDRFERLRATFPPEQRVAEQVLAEVIERLRSLLPEGSELFRVAPSRFATTVPDDFAMSIAERVVAAMRTPVTVGSLEARLTASVGVGLWPEHAPQRRTAADHAHAAMIHARDSGGNLATAYDASFHNRAYSRMMLESDLSRALARGQLELHYQPQVGAGGGDVVGVEALIRWRHPELGMVSPLSFIPIAEETGLIREIGAWVLRTACADAQRWSPDVPGLRVSVNLSAVQLAAGIAELVRDTLDVTQLDGRRLKLELTETMMVHASPTTSKELGELRGLGVEISIDDFGTGYSSLTNLCAFPIGEVKIDRSFVRHVPDDRDNCSIVTAVIEMAHSLGLKVVAEGVEDRRQLEFLRQRGCDVIQGYYFAKPLPGPELLEWAIHYQPGIA